MKTIAVIEDDLPIGNTLEALLRREGYGVLRAYSGTEALYLLASKRPDLVLLDLMLPGLPGEAVLPQIHGIPVIVLSAKGDVQDKVSLLRSGAVDYVTKPFHPQELLARIAAHLRAPAAPDAPLSFASFRLDCSTHTVSSGSKSVHLTKTESAILKLLMQNPNQALSKGVILDRISLDTPDCTESSLKQHVSNLRKKLKALCGKDYIQSVWGIGFVLTEES